MRLSKLRPASVAGLILGLVGIVALISGVFTPLCMSSEPIAPGACPPSLNPIEVRGLFVALVSLIVISAFALAYSFFRPRTSQGDAHRPKTRRDLRAIWAVSGIVVGALVAAAGILDGFVMLCPLDTGCSGSYPTSVLPLLVAGAIVLALSVVVLGLSFMRP